MLVRATRTKDRFTVEPSVQAVVAQATAAALVPSVLGGALVSGLPAAATAAAGIPVVTGGSGGAGGFGANFGASFGG